MEFGSFIVNECEAHEIEKLKSLILNVTPRSRILLLIDLLNTVHIDLFIESSKEKIKKDINLLFQITYLAKKDSIEFFERKMKTIVNGNITNECLENILNIGEFHGRIHTIYIIRWNVDESYQSYRIKL